MNVIGIGNYGLINSNYAKKTSTDEQLELELNNDRNWKNINRWTNLLDYL